MAGQDCLTVYEEEGTSHLFIVHNVLLIPCRACYLLLSINEVNTMVADILQEQGFQMS